jgi:FkbM family methyltransferase
MNFFVHKLLRKASGLKNKYTGHFTLQNRIRLLHHYGIETLLDVGANTGQFAYYTRYLGYKNEICSFEPLSETFTRLEKFAESDPRWQVYRCAVGSFDGSTEINISANSLSSSILEMMPLHLQNAPESAYVAKELVPVFRLDTLMSKLNCNAGKSFLKIDTQGYEMKVIEGAHETLKKIRGIQLECSIVELYKGETLIVEMMNLVTGMGFKLCSLEPGFYDKSSGQLLQVDAIFYRD